MRNSRRNSVRAIHRRMALYGSLVLVGGAIVGLTTTAGAAPIVPTGITATASTANSGLAGAVPAVLAAVGDPITLAVTLTPAGAAFSKDTKLALTATLARGTRPAGTLSPAAVIMPAGANQATFTISYSAVDNGVIATVGIAKATGQLAQVTSGSTTPFDVLKVLEPFSQGNSQLDTGLGVGNADCTQASTESECGTIVLSHGITSPAGALSLGACTPDPLNPVTSCASGSQIVQFVADLGTSYSPTDPALLIIRCSKAQCAGKGVSSYTVKFSQSVTGALAVSKPCVSKGVATDAAGLHVCTDYVQSHRDNAGDALLYLLFTDDMRAST